MNPLGQFIGDAYTFAQGLVGLCAFAMLVYAGIQLLNPFTKTDTRAKAIEIIKDVVYGTVLLFSAYVILNTISHDLVSQAPTPGLPQQQQ